MKKYMTILEIVLLCGVWLVFSVFSWLKPAQDVSVSERRPLQQLPEITAGSVLNTKFMSDFDAYTVDQFPFREGLRTLKALSAKHIFLQKDNNGIFLADGHAAKLDFPLNETSLNNAAAKLQNIHDKFLAGTDANVYFSIVPDKNYYLAEPNGYPALDYDKMLQFFRENLDFAAYVDIFGTLTADDYYRTDSHWKQENIAQTVLALAEAMSLELTAEYEAVTVEKPFYGVYYGQAALPLQPDTITYLTNEILENCTVYNAETGKTTGVYDMEKLNSNDPYEIFLSGAAPILYLENPACQNGKELIVFRDSYGSSLVPLLAEAYSKITIVDTRYVVSEYLDQFVDFSAADDVLFLYCTTLLNSSSTLK